MLPVFTSSEMRACDEAAISRYGIPGIVLMENAARGAVDYSEDVFGAASNADILILAGKGNNGGDGFAMARHYANRGARVRVLTLGSDSDSRGDALTNLVILRNMITDGASVTIDRIDNAAAFAELLRGKPDLVVDAMLGTGLVKPVTGIIADITALVNAAGLPVFSVDIPTGLSAEHGEILGIAVSAHATATMGGMKRGMLLRDGPSHCGDIRIIDISMPRNGFAETATTTFQIQRDDARRMLPTRRQDAHKYQVGSVFVIAGSVGLTGAAALASEAALRSGAGIVKLGVPAGLNAMMEQKLTEVMTLPLAETAAGSLGTADAEIILEQMKAAAVTVLGPGLGRDEETQQLVRTVVSRAERPLLIDADGLYALSGHLHLLREAGCPLILTPHSGEFARLLKLESARVEADRVELARSFAAETGLTLVLKGAPTLIATADGRVVINSTGNPGMATAGSGDVLSGLIAGLQAQGAPAAEAAIAGVYLHGLAGDSARHAVGEHGMIASDLLLRIVEAMRLLSGGGETRKAEDDAPDLPATKA